ncbi:MAG TPA: HAD-IA family hydrolase [Candidatus Saccharimonadia bacterium]|nr:HAD-IA family hydrolase [Candidatus Saccharimonadia bacterium]
MAAIIFDFDGTIADSFETIVQVFHELTGRHDKIPPEEIQRLRGMSLHKAAKELEVRPWAMPFLVIRGRRVLGRRIADISAHAGIPETVRKLYAEGHQLFIMSSNSEANIQLFLQQHHMAKEFIRIYGSVGLLSKARVIRKIRRQNQLGSDNCWYIGDEVRDVEAAEFAGINVIAVTWGFNTAELLNRYHPTAMADTPKELLSILENV